MLHMDVGWISTGFIWLFTMHFIAIDLCTNQLQVLECIGSQIVKRVSLYVHN